MLFILPIFVIPSYWCGREVDVFWARKGQALKPFARAVIALIKKGTPSQSIKTGHWQYDGEWQFGSYQMAGLGFIQFIKLYPEMKDGYQPFIEFTIDNLLKKEIREFDTRSWNEDALENLDSFEGHAGYLGYLNLLLSLYRTIKPDSKFNTLNEKITEGFIRILEGSDIKLIETYPNETYPVDNAAVIASIGVYDRVAGKDHSELLQKCYKKFEETYREPVSGLLFQSVDFSTGKPVDKPRGSGTALAAYFFSFANKELSYKLFTSLKKSCARKIFGLGYIREYPINVAGGWGDIDSGPVIFGAGVSTTGFTLPLALIHKDKLLFTELFRTATLVGWPVASDEKWFFAIGGPLGNAIMFAMLSAGENG
ncbi:hypothetical protein ACFL35_13995 [Candidatus Riflebacteria bacterium]